MDYNRIKRELYKELQIFNNHTLAFYYTDYTKILSSVIRKTKIIEHDKLIQNIQNKAKTTLRGVINKESGRNKERSEIQDLNMKGKKKSQINKLLLKIVMIILLL